jgi:hypothetical protein
MEKHEQPQGHQQQLHWNGYVYLSQRQKCKSNKFIQKTQKARFVRKL